MEQLDKSEVKQILNYISENFGIKNLKLDYLFFKNNKNKIFILTKDFNQLSEVRAAAKGLYFAKRETFGLRLSLEGAQIIGPLATKNIYELKNIEEYMSGKNLDINDELNKLVIIKHKDDFLGCCYYKNGKLTNYLPKERRLKLTSNI